MFKMKLEFTFMVQTSAHIAYGEDVEVYRF